MHTYAHNPSRRLEQRTEIRTVRFHLCCLLSVIMDTGQSGIVKAQARFVQLRIYVCR